jgi:hypothetical protein
MIANEQRDRQQAAPHRVDCCIRGNDRYNDAASQNLDPVSIRRFRMNVPTTWLFIGGIFNLGFVVFHLLFWRLFRWKQDLALLTPINRAVMQILNLCLTFMFVVMAYVSFFHATELIATNLGKTLLILFSIFWFLRMIEQVIFFGIQHRASLALTLIFLGGSVIYLMPVLIR